MEIDWNYKDLADSRARAAYLVGGLAERLRDDPLRPLSIADLCRREAVASARLQGFATSMEPLLRHIEDPVAGGEDRGALVAYDIYRAMRTVVHGDPGRHLTVAGLLELERRATVLGRGAGEPAPEREPLARGFLGFLDGLAGAPPLVAVGAALHHLHRLDPIGLDNRRLGRLLVAVLAWRTGLCEPPALMLSEALVGIGRAYRATATAPLADWLGTFFDAVAAAATAALRRHRLLVALRGRYLARCPPARSTSRIAAAVDLLFERPLLSTYGLQRSLGLSYRGAQVLIERLYGAGLVVEVSGRRRDRLFFAHEIAAID